MAEHIQIGDISPRVQYTGNGSQTVFTYPFPIFTIADMEVWLDNVKQSTGFTVNGAGQSAGGDVTFDTAPASAVVVTLKRRLAIQRTTDFQESGEFRAKVINDELDYLTASLQQVDDDLGRSIRLSATDTANSLELPDKAARVGKFLGFDDPNGDPIATDATGPQGPQGPAGNMDGTNNLSELTDPATARTNLGLGTAATKNTGTSNGDVVELDATGLPAVNGSQLTGLSTSDNVARTNIVLNAFRIAINGGLSVLDMVDGVVDEFEDETGVDTGASSNETYDATGDFYTDQVAPPLISQATGTAIGDMTTFGGIAAAFDTTKVQVQASSASTTGNPSTANIGKDWGASNDKTIHKFIIYGSSDNGIKELSTSDVTIKLQGSTDNFSSSIVDLYTDTAVADSAGVIVTVDSGINVSTAYRYHRILYSAGQSARNFIAAELEFYEAGSTADMTLISNATTALAQPDEAFIVLWQEDVDAIALNTDLKAYASRDGGTTWTQITLAEEANLSTGRILTGTADISGQPAGTSMKYKIETLNTKEQRLHGVGLEWS